MKSSKNSILYLLHLPPPVHGSSIVGAAIKDSELINNEFDCVYVNLLASKSISESGKISFRKILNFISIFLKVFLLLIFKRPKLCYLALSSTRGAFLKDVVLVMLLKIFHIKRVFHLHNKGVSIYAANRCYRLLYKFVFKNSSVILLSNALYYDIQDFVPFENIYICPNGIYDETNNTLDDVDSNKKDTPTLLFLSNLISSKGVYVLLDACTILQQKGYKFACDFVGGEGDITLDEFNSNVKKRGLSTFVKYLGQMYGVDKQKAFRNADIFVHPTMNDCFPLVLLEAMQNSLPVISTIEGGIVEIVDDKITGYLVQKNNVDSLVKRIEILLSNVHLRHQMGAAGRLKYENEYTLLMFEKKIVNILKALC